MATAILNQDISPVHVELDEKVSDQYIETAYPDHILDPKNETLRAEADRAEEFEHNLTTWQAVKMYRAAVFWSIVATMSIIMEGE
jgi:hypothetical protein